MTAYSNVSLKCLAFVRPGDCWDNSLRWYFNDNSGELESGEKYDIQERKTNTTCKTDLILTIVNVTEADEGKYKCQWLCEEDYPSFSRSSIIQLKVFPPSEEGTVTLVISKGIVSRNNSKSSNIYCENIHGAGFRPATNMQQIVTKLPPKIAVR